MAELSLESVSKQFPDGTFAVRDLSLKIEDKEFLVLVGPSGCGKSTTLRIVAGLEHPTSGSVKIGDEAVVDKPPKDRNIAMVFQNYALYPHMSVYKNLSFGLLLRYGGGVLNRGLIRIFQPQKSANLKRLRSGIDHQVRQAAEKLGISHLLDKKPHQLSGGERQRVALGRAIVREPAVFLFDEPLSNLDAKLRQQMRVELKRLHRELEATIVYVTHDQVEAMTMGDRIAVMKDGEILQTGTPDELYHRPANTFVAQFIGSVPTNLIPQTAITNENEKHERHDLLIGFRAEHARIKKSLNNRDVKTNDSSQARNNPEQPLKFSATVQTIDRLGDSTLVSLVIDSRAAKFVETDAKETEENLKATETNLTTPKQTSATNNLPEITVRTSGDSNWRSGQRVIVEVERNRLMWFDLSSGYNLDRENS
jgi:multiple sugar transport system ATP-binding protein